MRDEVPSVEQLYYPMGDTCVASGAAPAAAYLSVGNELVATTFAALTLQEAECGPDVQSGSRLRALYWSDEHQAKLDGYFFDSNFGSLCRYFNAADGLSRCLPLAGADAGHYLDAECTREASAINLCDARSSLGALLDEFIKDYAWV